MPPFSDREKIYPIRVKIVASKESENFEFTREFQMRNRGGTNLRGFALQFTRNKPTILTNFKVPPEKFAKLAIFF